MSKRKISAGLLIFRQKIRTEVLLVHPGGPLWARRDEGAWSIPKGELDQDEDPLTGAIRELQEETGFITQGPFHELGSCRLKSGKEVRAWAVEADPDPLLFRSNTFEMEWPPRSGRKQSFPETDRVEWFGFAEARVKINPGQIPLLERLEAWLDNR